MNRSGKRRLLPCLLLCVLLALTGCRTRMIPGQGDGGDTLDSGTAAAQTGEIPADPAREAEAGDGASGGIFQENPEAERKTFDENAPAEIVPGTDRAVHGPGEGAGKPRPDVEAGEKASLLDDDAEQPARRMVPAEAAERMGVSGEAEAADSAVTYFTVLLKERTGALFECKRLNAYWETEQDHVTVHKTAPEHRLILDAGVYDVSARLLPENLRVDDGWVVRKDPGVIVKTVDQNILGSKVLSDGAARAVTAGLLSRPGWAGVDAVRNRRVLLLSKELTETPYGQLAASLLLAMTAYPAEFADIDAAEALRMLMEEAAGAAPAGIYYYTQTEENR